jgi:hypothetical protein
MMGRSAGENTVNETAGTGPTVFDPGDGSAIVGNVSGANPQVSPPVNVPPANADGSPCSDASTATLSSAADARQSATDSTGSSDASTTAPGNAAAEPEAWVSPARSGSGWGESSSSAGGHSDAESATWGHLTGGESHPQSPMHAVARTLASATGVSATFGIGQTNALAVSPDVGSSQANVGSAGVRAWRHWRWFVVLGIIGLTIAVPVFPLVWVVVMGKAELARAIAETDALDPNWRWEDRFAWLAHVPADRNGWPLIEEVYRCFDRAALDELIAEPVVYPLRFWAWAGQNDRQAPGDQVLPKLKLHGSKITRSWELLRQLPRYEIISRPWVEPFAVGWLCAIGHLEDLDNWEATWVALCWCHEHFLLERKLEAAEECLLILAHLANIYHENRALIYRTERHLCLASVSEQTLRKLQAQIEQLSAWNPLLSSVQFERAYLDRIYRRLEAGQEDWFEKRIPEYNPERNIPEPADPTMWEVSKYYVRKGWNTFIDKLERATAAYFVYRHHAELLSRYNHWHRLATAPPERQLAVFASRIEPRFDTEDLWAGFYLPQPFYRGFRVGVFKLTNLTGLLNHRAQLQTLRVAIAAERYRLKYGQWPDKLETLVPEFLAEVPGDPFNLPNPLRLVRTVDGLVVYSIGLNLRDDGGDGDYFLMSWCGFTTLRGVV